MEILYYVRRCKNKTGYETHNTLHCSNNNMTFCGKELNEMWFIESTSHELNPDSVSCKKCKKLIKELHKDFSRI